MPTWLVASLAALCGLIGSMVARAEFTNLMGLLFGVLLFTVLWGFGERLWR